MRKIIVLVIFQLTILMATEFIMSEGQPLIAKDIADPIVFRYTYYVTQAGAGAGDGSSIENAMSIATHNGSTFLPNDRIVLSGTITSAITVPSSGNATGHITYEGNDGVNPPVNREMTYNGTGQTGVVAKNKSYITIQNFTVINGATGISFYEGADNINIYKCNFQQMLGTGLAFNGTQTFDTVTNIVVGGSTENQNIFYNVGVGTGSQDISVVGGKNVLISHNKLYADIGTGAITDRGIDGIVLFRTHDFIIEHNQLGPHWNKYTNDPTGGNNAAFEGTGEDGIDMKDLNYDGIVRYNRFVSNRQSGLTIQSGSHDIEVHDNYFEGNMWGGLWTIASGPSGTMPPEGWGHVRNLNVHHNIFYRNIGYGFLHNATPESTGIAVSNNVFVENGIEAEARNTSAYTTGLGLFCGIDSVIKDNIFYNNRPDYATKHNLIFGFNATGVTDSNVFYESSGTSKTRYGPTRAYYNSMSLPNLSDKGFAPVQEDKSIEADPLFVDIESGNFHLKSESPAIGKGI